MSRHLVAMLKADEAEARGDARAALEVMERMAIGPDGRDFWRPWRLLRLLQIAIFKDLVPGWGVSRWVLAQAAQALPAVPDDREHDALRIAVELRGGIERLPGVSPEDAECKVMDHDWVFRQLHLYDHGALDRFLRDGATPDLLAGADQVDAWVEAPMRGLRLECRSSNTVIWAEARSGELVVVPNLGCAVGMEPGQHVLGRLVPIQDGVMLESAPLLVPAEVANAVDEGPTGWLEVLRQSVRGGELNPDTLGGHLFPLLSDLPSAESTGRLVGARVPVAAGSRHLALAVLQVARDLTEGSIADLDLWPCLSAALVEPDVFLHVMLTAKGEDRVLMAGLGERLAEPAASVCRLMVDEDHEAA